MEKKTRQTNYGGPVEYPDGYGKGINPPDDKYIDEVVNPAGGRPSWEEKMNQSRSKMDLGLFAKMTTPTDREIQAEKADQAYMERSRQFRITEAAATGKRNSLFDEEELP